MPSNTNDLSALLGARICHDLISPLSAISNGLELLSMTGQPQTPEFRLISESVVAANAQIKFFRIAFGVSDPKSVMAHQDVSELVGEYFHSKRLSVFWRPNQDLKRDDIKTSLITMLCVVSAMPYGGEIIVTTDGGDLVISASAKTLKSLPTYWDILTLEKLEIDLPASQIQFGLLRNWLIYQKTNLEITHGENEIVVRFQAGELV